MKIDISSASAGNDPFRPPLPLSGRTQFLLWLLLFWCVSSLCILVCPFTRVEERFNMNAMYDLLYRPLSTLPSMGNHQAQPEPVLRTFLGATIIASLSWPLCWLVRDADPLYSSLIVRCILGLISASAMATFVVSIQKAFNRRTAWLSALLLATQFHLQFYATRPMSNIYQVIIVLFALSAHLRGRIPLTITLLSFASAIFRFETAILLLGYLLSLWVQRRIPTHALVKSTFVSLTTGALLPLALILPLDSWFYGRWCWPEWDVFYFNGILGKSVDWGVLPWHYYLAKALPFNLLLIYPIGLIALFTVKPIRSLLIPCSLYLLVLSLSVGHKEPRFLYCLYPVFTLAAACWLTRRPRLALVVVLLQSLIFPIKLYASSLNYAAGQAILETKHLITRQKLENRDLRVYHVLVDYLLLHRGQSSFIAAARAQDQDHVKFTFLHLPEESLEQHLSLHSHYTHVLTISDPPSPAGDKLATWEGFTGVHCRPVSLRLIPWWWSCVFQARPMFSLYQVTQ